MKCTARVTVTLEMTVGSTWGGDCPLSQVHKQAKDDARGMLHRTLEKTDARIIGEMQVRAIIVDEERP